MTKFNEVINKAYNASGMTKPQFAKALGVTRPTLTSWLTGRYQPRMGVLPQVACALGVDVRELIG